MPTNTAAEIERPEPRWPAVIAAFSAVALHVAPVPDRASFVTELTRVIYDTPEGKSATTDALLQQLAQHLDAVRRFQSALLAVQPPGGALALAMAAEKRIAKLDFGFGPPRSSRSP